MPQNYTIKQVSQQEPKRYEGKFGVTYYHKVRFEGSDEVIEIGRKEGNDPKVGEQLYGTIEDTEYGKKFKAEKNPNGYSGGGKSTKDEAAIKAMWAIGQAVSTVDKFDPSVVLQVATTLYDMIEDVKNHTPAKPSLKEQWNNTLASKDTPPVEAYKDVVAEVDTDEEINLDDIPF